MNDNKYNGWTNYATWRINLEIFDGLDVADFNNMADDAYEFGEYLKDYAIEIVTDGCDNNLAESYARAFMSEVNWTEIATSMIENQSNEVAA